MDYSKYSNFPFPQDLDETDQRLKARFLELPDDAQLSLLWGCQSYEEFHYRVQGTLKDF